MQKKNMTPEEKFMREAIRQAKKAAALGEVPIGCVIEHEGRIIGRGYNRRDGGSLHPGPRGDHRHQEGLQGHGGLAREAAPCT